MTAPAAPLISVITVCYNARRTLPVAAQSLHEQAFTDYEWIVVDGGSTDGSVEWLTQVRERIDVLVSERDKGIYDAMNKGVQLARGEWIFFLNADDRFADNQVLADLAGDLRTAGPGIGVVFGDAIYTDGSRNWQRSFHWVTERNLVFGDLCHQVVFARRRLFNAVGAFDVSLRINADFDWLLRVVQQDWRLHHTRRNVAYFFKGGAHVKAAGEAAAERSFVRSRYCKPIPWRLGNFWLRVELKVRRLLGELV